MVTDKSRKRLPPYISYRTFWNFVYRLQQGIPARLDRSYWGDTLSGSNGTHLMGALRFLGLIDDNGVPTGRLRRLVSAKNEQRTELLREMTYEGFGFLLQGSFDPQTATYAQLQETFQDKYQPTGDVCRKCIKFFVALASDAGILLSPFITKHFRTMHSSTGTKAAAKRTSGKVNRNLVIPQNLEEISEQMSWDKMLLTKFPTFDPAWSDEVKLKWLEAFDELLRRGLAKG